MMIEKIAELLTDHDPNPRQGVFWFGSVRFGSVWSPVWLPVQSGPVGSGRVRSGLVGLGSGGFQMFTDWVRSLLPDPT